jgi:excisionase family DNA binding protein
MSRLLSIGEAAKELNVSKDTIRRLALHKREIRHVRVSRRVLIPCEEIDRVVREGTKSVNRG